MSYADDQGVKLWYEVKGDGPTLVLTGGFGLLHDQWANVTDLLSEHFKVINWNYRGVGMSDRSWAGGYTLDQWVDDLAFILDHLGVDKTHLWGTSTGSYITTRFAARYGDRVQTVTTYPLVKGNVAFRTAFDGFLFVAEKFGYDALAKLTQWIGAAEPNVFGGLSNELARFESDAFQRNFSIESLSKTLEMFGHTDLIPDVSKLKMPVQLLMGNSGHLGAAAPGTAELAAEFMENCPHAEIALVEDGGGTYCMIEKPEETSRLIIDWINRHK